MKKYKMVITNKCGERTEYNSNDIEYLRKKYKKFFYVGKDMSTRILDYTIDFFKDGYKIDHLF